MAVGWQLPTENMDFMFNIAETDDIELYNRDVKKSLLDHYGDKTTFCLRNWVAEKRDFDERWFQER